MKVLKKIVLAAMVASSLAAVSTTAFAETDKGRIVYAPAEAIDLVGSKLKAAVDAIAAGDGEAVAGLVKGALDLSKEINANDKVDPARNKANKMLKSAIKLAKEGDLKGAEKEIQDAQKAFVALKSLI